MRRNGGFAGLAPALAFAAFALQVPAVDAAGCTIFAFGNGTSIINSATSITGDVCYSNGVVSTTNQKAPDTGGVFNSTVRVHSGATFDYTDKNFFPTGGIITDGSQDAFLDAEDARLKTLSSDLGALAPNVATTDPLVLGSGEAATIFGIGGGATTVIQMTMLDLNGATLTLDGDGPFVFNFSASDPGDRTFDWSQSELILSGGLTASQIVWNFLDAYDIMINKADTIFAGMLLAPTSDVEYHNPASFTGSISALNINLHSDFNLTGVTPIPVPAALPLYGSALVVMGLAGWRRKRRTA